MCPPFGSNETIMASEMPLGGGIHRISSQATGQTSSDLMVLKNVSTIELS